MPTNKVVRISTDTTPLQELRQQAATLWNDFNNLEGGFKKLAEDTVGVIQKQIDLLERRNQLMNGGMGSPGQPAPGNLSPISSGVESILEKIYDTETLIYRRLGESFDPSVGGSGPTGGNGVGRGQGGALGAQASAGGRVDFAGAMNDLMSGNLAGSIGKLAGGGMIAAGLMIGAKSMENAFQLNLSNYRARNVYEAELNNYGAWYKRWIPGRAAATDKAREALSAYEGNLQAQYLIASLMGVSADEAFEMQRGSMSRIGGRDGRAWERYAAAGISGAGAGALTGAGIGTIATPVGTAVGSIVGGVVGAVSGLISQSMIEARNTNRDEYHDWASVVLGQNMTEYAQNFYNYRRAAGGIRADVGDIQQAMVGQKIYNLDPSKIQQAFGVTRFGSGAASVAGVMSLFNRSLGGFVSDPTEMAVRLEENLDLYSNLANFILGTRGSFSQTDITGVITGLQGTGVQGQQLNRLAGALLGQGGGGTDVSKAMRMRSAIAGGARSLSDILGEAEAPSARTMKETLRSYERMYGGNTDLLKIQLARELGVSIKDINELFNRPGVINEDGTINFDALYSGTQIGEGFSETTAAGMVSGVEASAAGVANRKMIEGYNLTRNIEEGKVSREDVVSALTDARVKRSISSAVEEGMKNAIRN